MVFPSKTVTYLAAGCPVIASVNRNSEVGRTIEESKAGVVVEPENPKALLSAIQYLRAGDIARYGQNAKQYATMRWSPERVLGYFEATLLGVARGNSKTNQRK
jgi:glycosyltransferase involved in cell wall biosynthesis